MNKRDRENILDLICEAKKELYKACDLLNTLTVNPPQDSEIDTLETVSNYILHADSIVSWLRNSITNG